MCEIIRIQLKAENVEFTSVCVIFMCLKRHKYYMKRFTVTEVNVSRTARENFWS